MWSMTHKVIIIESERGWGRSVIEEIFFDTRAQAIAHVLDYNKDLPASAPDYYIMARYEGEI